MPVFQMTMDQDDSDAEEDEEDVADDESFASVDDLEGMSFHQLDSITDVALQTRASRTSTNSPSWRKRTPSSTNTSKKTTRNCWSLIPRTCPMRRTKRSKISTWTARPCPSSQQTFYADGRRLCSTQVLPRVDPACADTLFSTAPCAP